MACIRTDDWSGELAESMHRESNFWQERAREESDTAYEDIGLQAAAGFERAEDYQRRADALRQSALAVSAAADAFESRLDECVSAAYQCMLICVTQANDFGGVLLDYDLLLNASQTGELRHVKAITPDFFSTRSTFDLEQTGENPSIVQIASEVDERLIAYLTANPSALCALEPAQFERLVANLLCEFGYEVSLTRRTRDGGVDIVAIEHQVFRNMYLVECKRYQSHRKVDVAAVRALHGVVSAASATKGILVTTSKFTAPAQQHIDEHQWILEGHDYQGLLDWLNRYQRLKLGYREQPLA